jgi:cleavage and polyadenylation specificity factor subunit 1
LGEFELPKQRFDHVHIDIVGPLPSSEGFRYVLTMIDRFSRWPEAVPISDQTAEQVSRTFHEHWVCRYGVPRKVTTDRGRQFESNLFRKLNQLYGTQRIHTTAYNPKANGMVERIHRTIKAAIMAHANPQWTKSLATIMLGLRTSFRAEPGCTPAEMLYGCNITLPGEFFTKSTQATDEAEFIQQLREMMRKMLTTPGLKHSNSPIYVQKELKDCTAVFVRKDRVKAPLEQPYSGPYKVIKRNEKYFTILIKQKPETVSIDRVKAAHQASEEPEVSPSEIITKSGHRIRFMVQ